MIKFIYLSLFINILTSCIHHIQQEKTSIQVDVKKIKQKAQEAFQFCTAKKYNTEQCILIDMSIHSGKDRFFLWDFNKDTITYSSLVSHGCYIYGWNKENSKENPVFSNDNDSHCSSLGKYKIGERGVSQWGIKVKYLLHGLDKTNSNAVAREIVLHSWDAISAKEIYPNGTPEGWGCPAVSNICMQTIDPWLKTSNKPVLLWIFN